MSTSVCQGIQSQFDPRLVEPRILGFKLSQPTPKFSLSSKCFLRPQMSDNSHAQQQTSHKAADFCSEILNQKKTSGHGDLGGWSFLQALTNPTQSSETEKDKDNVYVHPLVKKSTSVLSDKSLEMCTESLGSETGSTISDDGSEINSSSFMSDVEKSTRMPCFTMIRERPMSSSSFPPPISTIRGGSSGGFQVETRRQDGRLVMKAVSLSANQSCFKAERMDGRLRLRFLDCSDELDDEDNHDFIPRDESYDAEVSDDDRDNDEEDMINDDQLVYDIEGRCENVGDEVEVNNSSRRSWCNEERTGSRRCKEMQSWGAMLGVASS